MQEARQGARFCYAVCKQVACLERSSELPTLQRVCYTFRFSKQTAWHVANINFGACNKCKVYRDF